MLRSIVSNLGVYGAATFAVVACLMFTLAAPPAFAQTQTVEAESMTPSGSVGAVRNGAYASGGKFYFLWSNGYIAKDISLSGDVDKLTVRARGTYCRAWPNMVVRVDGTQVYSGKVRSSNWTSVPITVNLAKGVHRVEVRFNDDYRSPRCDRNLLLDKVDFNLVPEPEPEPELVGDNPFAGESFYIDPNSPAKRQANLWRESRPAAARQMDKIAAEPRAYWFGDDSPSQVQNYVAARVTTITNAGDLPVLVAYNIPGRDCGHYSAGGAPGDADYLAWVQGFANGIGNRKAVVIYEPDALPGFSCLNEESRQSRLKLMRDAVEVLKANPNTKVYIDSGHPYWINADVMAQRLKGAGIDIADGFSLNVSNYISTSENIAYGKKISSQVGGKHFVIDTSRNGLGHADMSDPEWWCNPPGRALGPRPTAATADPLVDAYYWIKYPGGSDGTCHGGPSAGTWWPEYALGLAQRAAY